MDWKTIGNVAALAGVLVAMLMMNNQINARLDRMQAENNRRFDMVFDLVNRMQAENNRRFDALQAENNQRHDEANRRFDALQAENNRRHDEAQAENNRRHDEAQAENNRRHEELLNALRSFDRRISRLEGRLDVPGGE